METVSGLTEKPRLHFKVLRTDEAGRKIVHVLSRFGAKTIKCVVSAQTAVSNIDAVKNDVSPRRQALKDLKPVGGFRDGQLRHRNSIDTSDARFEFGLHPAPVNSIPSGSLGEHLAGEQVALNSAPGKDAIAATSLLKVMLGSTLVTFDVFELGLTNANGSEDGSDRSKGLNPRRDVAGIFRWCAKEPEAEPYAQHQADRDPECCPVSHVTETATAKFH